MIHQHFIGMKRPPKSTQGKRIESGCKRIGILEEARPGLFTIYMGKTENLNLLGMSGNWLRLAQGLVMIKRKICKAHCFLSFKITFGNFGLPLKQFCLSINQSLFAPMILFTKMLYQTVL